MAKFKMEGMKQLQKKLKRLGDVPQKAVTPSARKGMNIALKAARNNAPVRTGELRDGMKLAGEKSRHKGKKVYQVVIDRAKNHVFQKPVKNPGEGRQSTAYYPASMNYGYFTKNGNYIPGYHFMEISLESNSGKIEKTIISEMSRRIDKEIGR